MLLRNFSECAIAEIVTQTPITAAFENKIADSLLQICLNQTRKIARVSLDRYQQWQTWRDRITRNQSADTFSLCFQLQSPENPEQPWILEFQVAAKQDPSVRVPCRIIGDRDRLNKNSYKHNSATTSSNIC